MTYHQLHPRLSPLCPRTPTVACRCTITPRDATRSPAPVIIVLTINIMVVVPSVPAGSRPSNSYIHFHFCYDFPCSRSPLYLNPCLFYPIFVCYICFGSTSFVFTSPPVCQAAYPPYSFHRPADRRTELTNERRKERTNERMPNFHTHKYRHTPISDIS